MYAVLTAVALGEASQLQTRRGMHCLPAFQSPFRHALLHTLYDCNTTSSFSDVEINERWMLYELRTTLGGWRMRVLVSSRMTLSRDVQSLTFIAC